MVNVTKGLKFTKPVIEVSDQYLRQIINFQGRKTVGEVCRILETGGPPTIVKESVKNTLYQGFRDFAYLLYSYEKGQELVEWKFLKRKSDEIKNSSKEESDGK